jgi:hypothetical protein
VEFIGKYDTDAKNQLVIHLAAFNRPAIDLVCFRFAAGDASEYQKLRTLY